MKGRYSSVKEWTIIAWDPCKSIAWGPEWWLYCPVGEWFMVGDFMEFNVSHPNASPGMPDEEKRGWWSRDNDAWYKFHKKIKQKKYSRA